jgi:hypothetical protein
MLMTKIYKVTIIGLLLLLQTLVVPGQGSTNTFYNQLLTTQDKRIISKDGRMIKDVELNDLSTAYLLKGKLMIFKSNDPDHFAFVEVGEWVTHSTTTGVLVPKRLIDTTNYDNLGNITFSVRYYKQKSGFELSKRITKKISGIKFIQHVEYFRDGALVQDLDTQVIEHDTLKPDGEKLKKPIGTWNEYNRKGHLKLRRVFDDSGNLLKEEKYAR